MINLEYANAYSEVLEILKSISIDDYNKIPKSKIEMFETNANPSYHFSYNPNKTLDEQNVSKRAKAIIAILFRDYWATQEQKETILKKQNYEMHKLEEEKRLKYNPDDIFKNVNSKTSVDANKNITPIKEKNILSIIIDYIKNIFHFRK